MSDKSIRDLLFTDFDGAPVDDPDDVILEALDDPRYQQRIAPLTEFLAEESNPPYERFLACCALASWGERAGYRAIVDAARAGSETAWYGALIDRRYSADETFTQLADAVRVGKDFAREKSTEIERLAALRALIGIADRQYFDWQLAGAIDDTTAAAIRDDVVATVQRAIAALTRGERPSFDLGSQLAGLVVSVATIDESTAIQLGYELAQISTSPGTLIRLTAISSHGTSPDSRLFGEYLGSVGDEQVRAALVDASGKPK
ncbi:hypothetical protein [Nocardia suismassiliense]|uniref:hypothetical protein n=1 Tax=Nocardia suismassiliense TaxID=2077092 RepID=UPI001F2333C6|nr:hypothetical protein [Nocardia suismassiliense]